MCTNEEKTEEKRTKLQQSSSFFKLKHQLIQEHPPLAPFLSIVSANTLIRKAAEEHKPQIRITA